MGTDWVFVMTTASSVAVLLKVFSLTTEEGGVSSVVLFSKSQVIVPQGRKVC